MIAMAQNAPLIVQIWFGLLLLLLASLTAGGIVHRLMSKGAKDDEIVDEHFTDQ